MNFLSALFNINSLRKENARLQNNNTELALHNLQLVSQTETVKNHINTLNREVQSLRAKLANHTDANKPAKADKPAKMSAPAPTNDKRRGRPSQKKANTQA